MGVFFLGFGVEYCLDLCRDCHRSMLFLVPSAALGLCWVAEFGCCFFRNWSEVLSITGLLCPRDWGLQILTLRPGL